MKTNVTYESKKFFVNEEKGTVACKLGFYIDCEKIPGINAILDNKNALAYLKTYNIDFSSKEDIENGVTPYARIHFVTEGKSKASGGDKLDINLGEKVALTRAQTKAFEKAASFYDDLMSIIISTSVQGLCDLIDGCDDASYHGYIHVSDMLEPYTAQVDKNE